MDQASSPSFKNKRKRIDSGSMSDEDENENQHFALPHPRTPSSTSSETSPVSSTSGRCPFKREHIQINALSPSQSEEKEPSKTIPNDLSPSSSNNPRNLTIDNTGDDADEEYMEDDDCTSEFVRLDEIPDRTIGYNADPDILREFDVLDEFDEPQDDEDDGGISGDQNGDENNKRVKSSDKNDEDDGGDSSYTDDTDIPEDELEAMLEEGLPEKFKGKRNRNYNINSESPYEEKEKIVFEELLHNHFDVLPEGWIQVTHHSGIPIYLHKSSRVCTLSKPYFLGPGSARKHEVPLSAIPCLQYQRALEQEEENIKKMEETQQQQQENGIVAPHLIMPSARIETAQENKAAQSLNAFQIREYCRRLFRFKTIKVMRFKSWSDRRKYIKNRKQRKQVQRPTLPERTKLIKFPVQIPDNDGSGNSNRAKKEWIMNPNGKSYVCILHEYVQHALKKQPSYQFKELENAATPYAATVTISDMQYGVGYGPSKKQAKSEAAKATLEILIPEMRDKIEEDGRRASSNNNTSGNGESLQGQAGTTSNCTNGSGDGNHSSGTGSSGLLIGGNQGISKPKDHDTGLQFFDEVKIEDPRVAELCAKTTEPSPYAILLTCLQRNFGLGEMHIDYEMNTMRHQKHEFTMTVGRHSAKVICKNKRDGKQRASQAILQILHPHISSWGSLLRLYGNRSVKNVRVKKREEQEITALQSKAAVNAPNEAILEKLRTEMRRLKEMRAAVQPIGKFVPPHDITTCMPTQLNNVDI